jgi:putative salt-induced outer membrane protein
VTLPNKTFVVLALGASCLFVPGGFASADDPKPDENPGWVGSIGAGLALTSGNSDTKTFNLGGSATSDTKKRNILKIDGLFLKTSSEGETTVNRATLGFRDEYGLGKHAFAFGEVRYLHDEFKDIKYLISPLVGAGYRVIDKEKAVLSFDGAIGAAIEEPETGPSTDSGAFHAGESLVWKLTPSATFSEAATGLWKTKDTADALYHFEASLSASMNKRFELKIAFNDDYKNKPAGPTIEKNDTTLLANIVYKF